MLLFFFCQILTPLKYIHPCCALNTKKEKDIVVFNQSYSSWKVYFSPLEVQLKMEGKVLPFTYSAVGAQGLRMFCPVMRTKMVHKIYKRAALVPYSGCLCWRCILFGTLTTILFLSPSLTVVLWCKSRPVGYYSSFSGMETLPENLKGMELHFHVNWIGLFHHFNFMQAIACWGRHLIQPVYKAVVIYNQIDSWIFNLFC